MIYTIFLLSAFLLIAVVVGAVEYYRHQKNIFSIPIRVHINGTRGKSSVTRLIGAGLREGGIKTITKVTGTYPRLIVDDGSEMEIHRKGYANIIEQKSIVKYAAAKKAQALIIECMALDPEYQQITENKMIHATIGVITNARADHLDVMGPTVRDVVESLSGTIPAGKDFFTAENKWLPVFKKICESKNTMLHHCSDEKISDEIMEGFSYIEHKENVAIALDVCKHCGIENEKALKGMYRAIPDAGVLRRFVINTDNGKVTFYNALAANDPDSSFMIWRKISDEYGLSGKKCILLNTRQDRLERAKQLAEMSAKKLDSEIDMMILIGQSTAVVESMAKKYGMEKNKIVNIGWKEPEEVYNKVLEATNGNAGIVAFGNMGGIGAVTSDYFMERSLAK